MPALSAGVTFALADFKNLAESFAAERLTDYTVRLKDGEPIGRKEINDSIWGTTSISPVEVAFLDSPLLQRMRGVRQLGVIHWVYPGAGHSRFEHTLGVLRQVQYLTTSLNSLSTQRNLREIISPSQVQLLRLCALVHDIGHSAFSHVVEKALDELPGVDVIETDFSLKHKIEKKPLSEIFAFYVVRSPAMRAFVEVLLDKCGQFIELSTDRQTNLTAIIEKMSLAITGQKIDDRLPLLHEIISGPFDADKLDYFVRDARMAGTPSVLDISRLVQKISFKELDGDELPDDIGKSVDRITGKHFLFGLKWSGVPMLDELHLSRVLLYAKIYRHPKVLAIEYMLRAAIIALAKITAPAKIFRLVYDHTDEVLISLSRDALIKELDLDLSRESVEEHLDIALDIFADLRMRRLTAKAFEVDPRYPGDPLERVEQQRDGLTDFREEIEHPTNREKFHSDLIDEVEKILQHTRGSERPSRARLTAYISVHVFGQVPGGTEIARAYLLPASGRPIPFREYTVNRAAWADSYLSDQPVGLVFSPPEFADAVYVAVEKLVRIRHRVRLPASAVEASKRNLEKIQSLKRVLSAAGYYKDAPFDIRPIPSRLNRADVTAKIGKIATLLHAYQEPQVEGGEALKASPEERVFAWLRQFDTDEYVDCALQMATHIKMIGRVETVASIKSFVEKHKEFRGAIVVPFGNARDSGSVQTYFSADLSSEYIGGCRTLNEVVEAKVKLPVLFVDDFVGSGGQGQDILAAGFGVASMRKKLGEQRDMFSEATQEFLRSAKIGFAFTSAWDDGVKAIREACAELHLDATVDRHLGENELPFAFASTLTGIDPKVQAAFVARCGQIGEALILDGGKDDGEPGNLATKATERKLGYGNRSMLLASPFNVPAQTLTLIWASGDVDGVHWQALMPRRKKE